MLIVRPETPDDIDSIRYVNDQAFDQKDEAVLIEKLRKRGVLAISLVAVQDNDIVGHIAFSPVVVESEDSSFEAIALGPMAVLPMNQRKKGSARKWFWQVSKNAAVLDRK
jgi:putative acetyltransferase